MNILPIELTPTVLSALAGIVLSLSFTYIPKWRVYYGQLQTETKALIMLGVLAVTSAGIYALVHFGAVTPSQRGNGWSYFWMFLFALASNQATYTITPVPGDVLNAKATRRLPGVEYADVG